MHAFVQRMHNGIMTKAARQQPHALLGEALIRNKTILGVGLIKYRYLYI